jgi:hypothetical protein
LRSFTFEVSAGRRPTGVGDATGANARSVDGHDRELARSPLRGRSSRRRAKRPAPEDQSNGASAHAVTDGATPLSAEAVSQRAITANRTHDYTGEELESSATVAPMTAVAPALPQSEIPRIARGHAGAAPRRVIPSWIVSLGTHVVAASLLATVTLATVDPPLELETWISSAEPDELDFANVDLPSATDVGQPTANDVPAQLIDPGAAPLGNVSTESPFDGIATAPGIFGPNDGNGPGGPKGNGFGPFGEIGQLFGQGGQGMARFGTGLGGEPTAKFFGQEIEGSRIVFVLDNSGSMQGGRLETVIAELLRCVDSLAKDQEFYVIFHSDAIYPLFYPDPVPRYIKPTDANKKLLARWLDTVELCLGDSIDQALAAAEMIEPDAVFLLSDGRIQSEKKYRYLAANGARNFPIHTFAVGLGSSAAGRRNLETIAGANGGEFRESEIPAEMKDLARRKPRPYHAEIPGQVWGRNVKPFRPRG